MTSPNENVSVLIDAWKLMVGRFPSAKIEQSAGMATMFGNLPLPFFNISAPDRPLANTEELRRALLLAKSGAKACAFGSMLALCEAWVPADWEPIASEEGFSLAMNMTGMACEGMLPPRRAAPALELRRVSDEATARDLAMINAHAYQMPLELFECMANLQLWQPGKFSHNSFGYVGYADGRPVTSAATFILPQAADVQITYVALVATMPDAHGKGYAEAVMRHAIQQSQGSSAPLRLTLHASDMGRPLYQAMGFQPGGKVMLLMPSEQMAGH